MFWPAAITGALRCDNKIKTINQNDLSSVYFKCISRAEKRDGQSEALHLCALFQKAGDPLEKPCGLRSCESSEVLTAAVLLLLNAEFQSTDMEGTQFSEYILGRSRPLF